MSRIKGILYAAVSSSTFGLAPFFSITLLLIGFSAFEVLSYRWGIASVVLIIFGLWLSIEKKGFCGSFCLESIEGDHLFQFNHCISEHCQWGSVYDSFHVSAGCCIGYDVCFPGEKVGVGDCCRVDVLVRSICTFIGRSRREGWKCVDWIGVSLCFCFFICCLYYRSA